MNGCVPVGFDIETTDGRFTVEALPGSDRLPLLLAAYNAKDASSRYMWQDPHSVQSFVTAVPTNTHCLFLSYSGASLRQLPCTVHNQCSRFDMCLRYCAVIANAYFG